MRHQFRNPAPTRRKAAPDPRIHSFSSKSVLKVAHTLTHLSSPCSLRNICGEFGGSRWAHAVSTRQPGGRGTTLTHLVWTFYTLLRATHSPEPLLSPQAESSQRTDHCEHRSRCEIPDCLCMRALPHVFLSLPMFLFVFSISLPLGRYRTLEIWIVVSRL